MPNCFSEAAGMHGENWLKCTFHSGPDLLLCVYISSATQNALKWEKCLGRFALLFTTAAFHKTWALLWVNYFCASLSLTGLDSSAQSIKAGSELTRTFPAEKHTEGQSKLLEQVYFIRKPLCLFQFYINASHWYEMVNKYVVICIKAKRWYRLRHICLGLKLHFLLLRHLALSPNHNSGGFSD